MPEIRTQRRFSAAAVTTIIAALALALLLGYALWSLLGSRVIFEDESAFGRIQVVERSDGLRSLYMGDGRARQSSVFPGRPDHLEIAYTRVAMVGLGLAPGDGRILFVGLGGGAMPMYTREVLPAAQLEVVEIDPMIVDVAREYFGFRPDSQLVVHTADGRAFIEGAPPGTYDLIVLDAFSDDEIPYELTTVQFLQAVHARLAPGGVVVSNLWSSSGEYASMLATYHAVFDQLHLVRVRPGSQRIVVATSDARHLDGATLVEASRKLARRVDLGFDLPGLVERGYQKPPEPRAPVLEDRMSQRSIDRPAAAQEIDTLALESHARFLSDDLLEGRHPASRGEQLAALYLVSRLAALGLEPLVADGFRMPVPLTAVHISEAETTAQISGNGVTDTLRPPDFYHPGGGRHAFRSFEGDLVSAGAATRALDLLTGELDLAGKVVVLTPPWAGVEKVEAELLRRGASGTVQLVPNGAFYERLRIVRGPTRYFLPDGVADPANQSLLPGVVAGPAMIRALDLTEETGPAARTDTLRSLGLRTRIDLAFTTESRTGYNIGGFVRGADPVLRDEWVVYVAHYDHIGYGEPVNGDSIWNGFIDNAAGCAMLLEIARIISARPAARSVAFLFVTAEEQGLLGSNWFVHQPAIALDRITAVLNLDGGAPPAPPVAWGLVGAERSRAGRTARDIIELRGWSVRNVEPGPESDHWPFHLAGVPSLLLFPGNELEGISEEAADALRERWIRPHTPDDEWHPEFPLSGMQRYAELALHIGIALADAASERE